MEGGPLLPPSPNWAPAFAGVVFFLGKSLAAIRLPG
ncbi:hypothetical protein J3A66_001474 [Sphingomonas sp. PvP018]|nr:hypothetical protein [Sphingomonas sp. PvP018]